MSRNLTIERRVGEAIAEEIDALARLRIEVFREFPYLYDGDAAYEAHYLETYLRSPRSLVVLVRDGDAVVGASSALPMADETADFQRPFLAHGHDVERIFYCAESVLLPAYRGLGLGHRFFDEREAHARALGGFTLSCFCAVERPVDHPRRPAGYRPLDAFWTRRSYRRRPELRTTFEWKDLDEDGESAKTLVFWTRHLEPAA